MVDPMYAGYGFGEQKGHLKSGWQEGWWSMRGGSSLDQAVSIMILL